MLIFPLKKQWYEKIKSGEKTIEYREAKPYWTYRIGNELKRQCAFVEDMELFYEFSRGHRFKIYCSKGRTGSIPVTRKQERK